MRLIRFIGYGIAFTLAPEITNLIIINRMPDAFVGAMAVYCLLLAGGYAAQQQLDRLIRNSLWSTLIAMLLAGSFGLAFEWFVIGNSPWQNPDAIQWGMFVYWLGLFTIPRILTDPRPAVHNLAQTIKLVYLIYSAFHLAIALALPNAILPFVIPLLWVVVYTAFGGFYWRYLTLLRH
ncbi:MAG: hypothetical protein N2385_09590 [Chloroflexus sp.]|nr:hypothetical protein [Chloroflexus sp.]